MQHEKIVKQMQIDAESKQAEEKERLSKLQYEHELMTQQKKQEVSVSFHFIACQYVFHITTLQTYCCFRKI